MSNEAADAFFCAATVRRCTRLLEQARVATLDRPAIAHLTGVIESVRSGMLEDFDAELSRVSELQLDQQFGPTVSAQTDADLATLGFTKGV